MLSALESVGSNAWGVLAYPDALGVADEQARVRPVVPRRPTLLEFHGGWLIDELMLARRLSGSVFHATDPRRIPKGVKAVVATVYDLTPLDDAAVWDRLWPDQRAAYRRAVERLRRADALIAISGTVAHQLQDRLGVEPEAIHIVYPALGDVTPLSNLPSRDRADQLLFVGAPDPHKNLDVLLNALASIPAAQRPPLTVVGPWAPSAITKLRRDTRRLGLTEPSVHAFVTRDDLEDLYRAAAVLVLPSRHEGFGLPLVEAMARGVPVIASDLPVLREVAGKAALYVPVGDHGALATAIQRTLGDASERRRRSVDGLVRARQFSPENALRSLLSAYRSVGIELN